jgi:hypothetical protein
VTDNHGASVTEQVTITLRDNKPPIINSVTADPDWIPPSGTVQVTCNATDPDGYELIYAWLTGEGDISGTGAVITWAAPEAYDSPAVLVMVTDGYGGSAMNGVGIRLPVPAANTELHKAQTAIIAAMAEVETNDLQGTGPYTWSGEAGTIIAVGADNTTADASDFCYGPFRAEYTVNDEGGIVYGNPDITGGWGTGIQWNSSFMNWEEAP